MKISKKLALVMATVATAASMGATTAFANNCNDTSWAFSKWERIELTGERVKEDASSAYGSVTKGGGGGSEGRTRTTIFHLVDEKGKDFKNENGLVLHPISVMVNGNTSTYVDNYAHEYGYRNVRMQISRVALDLGVEARGYWSPDSV